MKSGEGSPPTSRRSYRPERNRIEMATTLIQEVGPNYWCLAALPLGVVLDLAIGDPRGWPHPVRAIGRMISRAERGLRVAVAKRGGGPKVEFVAGLVLVTVVVGLTGSLAWL